VDPVAVEHQTLVFVEVKTRNGTNFGTPVEAVDARKEEGIRRAAPSQAAGGRMDEIEQRFDVVAITPVGRDRRLELIKDAF
jgi:putative endonuclease